MARTRYLKPETAEDTRLAEVSRDARLLYRDLWCHMDKQGITEDDIRLIKKRIFPYDDDLTLLAVENIVNELVNIRRLFRFEWGGKKLLYCPSFCRHQYFHPGEKVKYAIPEDILLATCQHLASNVLTMFNDRANTPVTVTVTGTGTVTSTAASTGKVTGNGERITEKALKRDVEECLSDWQRTLEHFGIMRKAGPHDEIEIARTIQFLINAKGIDGAEWVKLAFAGARKQKASKNWDPKQFVSLRIYLDPNRMERLVNIGAGKETAEGMDWSSFLKGAV